MWVGPHRLDVLLDVLLGVAKHRARSRQADWQTDRQTGKQTDRQTDKEIDGQIHYLGPPLIVGHFEEGDRREPLHITKGHTRGVEGTHNVNPPGTHQSQLSTSTPRSGMSVTFSQT